MGIYVGVDTCAIETEEVMKVTSKPDSQMVTHSQLSPPEIPGPISTNSICENDQTLLFSCENLATRDYHLICCIFSGV